MKTKTNILTLALLSSVACTSAMADSVVIPNTFTAGNAAVAAEVNDNFSAVAAAINANDASIIALQTGSVSVSPHSFQSEESDGTCNWRTLFSTSNGYYVTGSAINCDPVAGIQLPDGVALNSLTCTFNDSAAPFRASARLYRNSLDASGTSIVFDTADTTNTGVEMLIDSTATADTEIVDNSTYTYHLTLLYGAGTDTANTSMRFYGCSVSYQ